ncbi:hypothetical protein ATKI12_3348 [Kitasatospora sp. Ki12]
MLRGVCAPGVGDGARVNERGGGEVTRGGRGVREVVVSGGRPPGRVAC